MQTLALILVDFPSTIGMPYCELIFISLRKNTAISKYSILKKLNYNQFK